MKSRITVLLALAVAFAASGTAAAQPAARPQWPHVLLISIDGFPAYLLDDPRAPVPTLRALAKQGTRAEGMRVSNPSVTWPNHTTLVTGVRPEKHSVLYNGILVRRGPAEPVRVEPAHDQAELVAVPTVFDYLHKAGLSTAGINWPCTRNSPSLDVNFPDVPENVKFMTAPLRESLLAAGILPEGGDKPFLLLGGPGRDQICTEAACSTLREKRPNFMLLHLLNVDAIHHKYGPQSAASYTAIAAIDFEIRDVLAALDAAGLRQQTTVIVCADHGFATATQMLLPNAVFRAAGLLTAGPTGIVRARVQAVPEGGTAMIYLNDPSTAAEDKAKVIELMKDKEGIAAVITPDEYGKLGFPTPQFNKQAPDLILAAKEGYAFEGSTAGDDFVIPAVLGRHTVGNHGYLNSVAKMNALFIASGRGIKPGLKIGLIDNLDVAPTVAFLLGQGMPNVDGKVLTEILLEK